MLNQHAFQCIKLSLAVFLLSTFSACSSFYLEEKPVPPEITATISRLRPTISYNVLDVEAPFSLGHQYLLLFPFRSITLLNASATVEREFLMAAALLGIRLQKDTVNPDLTLYIEDLDLTAYDLFFTRKIVADVSLRAVARSNHSSVGPAISPEQRFESSASDYVRYAFSEPLLVTLQGALRETLKKTIIWYGDLSRPSLR